MAIHKLNDAFIKNLKADGKHRRFGDGGNLWLDLSTKGAKAWMFVWFDQTARKQRERGLGGYPLVSLKEARALADTGRSNVRQGKEPLALKVAAVATFGEFMLGVLADAKKGWSASNRDAQERQWISGFRDHAAALLPMPINRIDSAAVVAALQPYEPTKVKENVRERIAKVLDAAAVGNGPRMGMSNPAKWKGELEHVLHVRYSKANAVPHKEMAFEELPAFIAELNALAVGGDNAAAGLLFNILNANRTDEAREIVRAEVNLDTGIWTIPADRMKAKKEHKITLSTQSLDLLRSIPEVEGNPYFFTGEKAGKPVNESAFLYRLYQMGWQGKATVHGFRATFTDWSGELGLNTEVTEMATAHSIKGARKSYRRRQADALRKDLLQMWADYCFGVSNVVTLKVAA